MLPFTSPSPQNSSNDSSYGGHISLTSDWNRKPMILWSILANEMKEKFVYGNNFFFFWDTKKIHYIYKSILVCENVMHEGDVGTLETLERITESLRMSFKKLK